VPEPEEPEPEVVVPEEPEEAPVKVEEVVVPVGPICGSTC